MGSIFLTGACLLPGSILVLSGELYIPNTSARASFVFIVTVGSAPIIILFLRVMFFVDCTLSLIFVEETAYIVLGAGGGPHFLPRSPIERARASCMLYSIPSENNKFRLNLSFSGRFPGAGGAIMSAYREAAVEEVEIRLTTESGGLRGFFLRTSSAGCPDEEDLALA